MLLKNKTAILPISFFLLVVVLPLCAGLIYSGFYGTGLTGILSEGFTLSHAGEVLSNHEFYASVGFSMYIAAVVVFISASLAMVLLVFTRKQISSGTFSYIIYLPLAIPALIAAFFSFQVLSGTGFFSRLLSQLALIEGMEEFPRLIHDRAGIGIIITHLLLGIPFFSLLFSNIYNNESLGRYTELAETLGAGKWKQVRKVLLPVILKKALPSIILYFFLVLGSYEIPLLLGRQSPRMLSVLVVNKLQRYDLWEIPQSYMISFIYILMVILLVVLLSKRLKVRA